MSKGDKPTAVERKSGRGKTYRPTQETRDQVKMLAQVGMDEEGIAYMVGISRSTLRRHHMDDLAGGRTHGDAVLRQTLYQMAVGRDAIHDGAGNVVRSELTPDKGALIFLHKARLGMVETDRMQLANPDNTAIKPGPDKLVIEVVDYERKK